MDRRLRLAAAFGVGFTLTHEISKHIATVRAALADATDALTESYQDYIERRVDQALALADEPADDQPEPCLCGSTEHTSDRLVHVRVPAHLDTGPTGFMRLVATFAYRTDEPHALYLLLTAVDHVDVESEQWVFARDLLDSAISSDGRLVGDGDVQAQTDGEDRLDIFLRDGDGDIHRLICPLPPVRELVVHTFELVPHGEGAADDDLNNGIQRLLDGTWED